MSKNTPPNKQKNQPGNAAPNTGIAGDKEQPEMKGAVNNSAGGASFAIRFKGGYLRAHIIVE